MAVPTVGDIPERLQQLKAGLPKPSDEIRPPETPVQCLGLPWQVNIWLANEGIDSIGQLAVVPEEDLVQILACQSCCVDNIGRIYTGLLAFGYTPAF